MKIQLETPELVIFESALFRTTTSLVIAEEYLLLVDPNWLPNEIEFIFQYITPLKAGRKCYMLFTHSDYDHIIGYARFADCFTIASKNLVENEGRETVLQQIRDFDDQYYIQRDYLITYPFVDVVISEEGQEAIFGKDKYVFYQATGHNADGIVTFNESKGILIVGDYLSNIEFPYIYHSIKEYKKTLDKIEQIVLNKSVNWLITGHGDATSDKVEILKRLKDSRNYIGQLEQSVINKTPFDWEGLMANYHFPKVMRTFHDGNVKLAEKELVT